MSSIFLHFFTAVLAFFQIAVASPISDTVAFTAWQMPDGSVRTVMIDEPTYDAWAIRNKAAGMQPGQPDPAAVPLMSEGGMSRAKLELHPLAWHVSWASFSDPGTGETSRVSGFDVYSSGQVVPISTTVANHHSVTKDFACSGNTTATGSTKTISTCTPTAAANYIAAMPVGGLVGNSATTATMTWAGASLTNENYSLLDPSNVVLVQYFDKLNPTTGNNNLAVTYSATEDGIVIGAIFCAGVNNTPIANHNTNSGGNTNPTVTVTGGAASGLVLSNIGWQRSPTPTMTEDASWTNTWNIPLAGDSQFTAGAAAYKAGSASDARTMTAGGALNGWAAISVEIQASSGAAAKPCLLRLLGVGGC